MDKFLIDRYPSILTASSNLDHFDDALDIIAFLGATDFVADQLKKHHGKTDTDSQRIAKKIASHAKIAGHYTRLCLVSPPEIAFLPGYYAVLNLAKIFSLSGKYSIEFSKHSRWHGVSYDTNAKNSQGLLTEKLIIRKGGALALFYKTITDKPISQDKEITLRDVYPIVPGIGHEVQIVTKKSPPMILLEFSGELSKGTVKISVDAKNLSSRSPFTGYARTIPAIGSFKKKPKQSGIFEYVGRTQKTSLEEAAREVIKTEYLRFRLPEHMVTTYSQNTSLPYPEEFASALVFFHLSSVCRYNPELLDKLSISEYWPLMLGTRRHTLFDFLLKTWSFVTQQNYMLRSTL